MKVFFTLNFFINSFVFAEDRIFTCNAVDRLDTRYVLEFNLDSGQVKTMKDESGEWKILYSDFLKCEKPLRNFICTQSIKHNLDIPNQSHINAYFEVRCKSSSGIQLPEMSARSEINSLGDGNGTFKCGRLPSKDFVLSNCILTRVP